MAQEDFSSFFNPLVGSPEATAHFRDRLARCARGFDDPYAGLTALLFAVVDDYVLSQKEQRPYDRNWDMVGKNIVVGGVVVAVSAVRGVGELYQNNATVPQEQAGVLRSTRLALGYVKGLSMMNRRAASINLAANRVGLNPNSLLLRPLFFGISKAKVRVDESLAKAFTATEAPDGQISIGLRHQRLGRQTDERCPASYARTEITPGRPESSLGRYLQVIGDVAIAEIYPKQFAIAPDISEIS